MFVIQTQLKSKMSKIDLTAAESKVACLGNERVCAEK